MENDFMDRVMGILSRLLVMLLITLILLEIMSRFVWGNEQAATLFGEKIYLLPLPLLTQQQKQSLQTWSYTNDTYLEFDPVLGWSIRPDTSQVFGNVVYSSNSIGIRSLREYRLTAPPGVIRLAAFGPSFTHGDEVSDPDTWAAQMEHVRPDLEVMNWGVGAYGTDQAFLRYQTEGQLYRPDIVLIGYEEDSLYRNVNRYHPFYNREGLPMAKPVFQINSLNRLTLLDLPFHNFDNFYNTVLNDPKRFLSLVCPADIFCNEPLYQPHPLDPLISYRFFRTLTAAQIVPPVITTAERTTAVETTMLLVRTFIHQVISDGAVPVVVFFPQTDDTLANYEKGIPSPYDQGVLAVQNGMKVDTVDLAAAFVAAKQSQNLSYQDFFVREDGGGHYSSLGNKVVAQALLAYLDQTGHLINRR